MIFSSITTFSIPAGFRAVFPLVVSRPCYAGDFTQDRDGVTVCCCQLANGHIYCFVFDGLALELKSFNVSQEVFSLPPSSAVVQTVYSVRVVFLIPRVHLVVGIFVFLRCLSVISTILYAMLDYGDPLFKGSFCCPWS